MSFVAKIITDLDNRGIKQATRQFGKFNKTVLGVSLGLTAATAAAVRFSKMAVKAAVEDEKAQALLNQTLRNSGFASSADAIGKWIDRAEIATGWADDELRPALGLLVRTTQDLTAAQGLLDLSMTVSAGTGKDLTTTANAIAKAFAGQRKGLTALGTGLDAAYIKGAPLDELLAELNERFSGAQQARLNTYSTKVDRLRNAITQGKEQIGQTLIDTFVKTVGDGDLQRALENVATLSAAISREIRGLGVLLSPLTNFFNDMLREPVSKNVDFFKGGLTALDMAAASFTNKMIEDGKKRKAVEAAIAAAARKEAKIRAATAAAAAAKERAVAAQKARQAALDKQSAELGMKYDTDRASIMVALSKTESYETRQRLTDMLALNTAQYAQDLGLKSINATWALINAQVELYTKKILDSNAAAEAAAKAANSIAAGARAAADAAQAASQAAGNISTSIPNLPAGASPSTTAAAAAAAAAQAQTPGLVEAVAAATAATSAGTTAATTPTNATPDVSGSGVSKATGGSIYGGTLTQSGPAVVVNVNGSVIAQQDLTTAVGEAVNRFVRLGGKLVPLE